MTIRKALFTLSLALPLALAGCPTTEEGGSDIFPCSIDADCAADAEICHPIGKICVPTCEEASDCPDNQNACEEIKNEAGTVLRTEKVCQCKTGDAAFCTSEDATVELVCSPVDNICETKCVTNDDCAAFTTVARECVGGICVLPALCTPTSCTDPAAAKCGEDGKCAACTADADCANIAGGRTHCDAGVCVVPSCNPSNLVPGTNDGPDICAYAQTCTGGACVDIPAPTCTGAANYTWNKSAKGPVVTAATVTTSQTSNTQNECGNGGPKTEITITFYAPNGFTHGGAADLINNRVRILKSTGEEIGSAFVRDAPASGAKSGTFTVGSCGTTSTAGRAVFLKDQSGNAGNAFCL